MDQVWSEVEDVPALNSELCYCLENDGTPRTELNMEENHYKLVLEAKCCGLTVSSRCSCVENLTPNSCINGI